MRPMGHRGAIRGLDPAHRAFVSSVTRLLRQAERRGLLASGRDRGQNAAAAEILVAILEVVDQDQRRPVPLESAVQVGGSRRAGT